MNFNVFVSYSTTDLKEVEALRKQLSNTPIKVFIAEHSITPSEELAPTINKSIAECDIFLLLWSKNAKDSGWVSQEIGKATAYKKKILPLVLERDCNPTGFISGIKYIPIYKNKEAGLKEAQEILEAEYEKKTKTTRELETKKRKDQEKLITVGIGAFLLWAANQ
ncbi:MAG: toll/interleukin-1 receptor domain-containing protein [Desulfotalea sp.]